jgi:multidrug efflux pump subunit AcrB
MRASYVGLLSGLLFSIVLVYLLIVVNFQSWLDPFIMISALPAALAGIAWFLFITHTTLSVLHSWEPSCAWASRPQTASWWSALLQNK